MGLLAGSAPTSLSFCPNLLQYCSLCSGRGRVTKREIRIDRYVNFAINPLSVTLLTSVIVLGILWWWNGDL
jgi:hypothetical protein